MFSGDKTAARKLYRVFMGGGTVRREDIYSTIDQRLLGGERFIEKVMGRYNGELSKGKRAKGYTLNEIAKGVEKVSGVTLKQIRGKSKSRDKTLLIYIGSILKSKSILRPFPFAFSLVDEVLSKL